MARFATYVLLAVLLVFPSVTLGRSDALDIGALPVYVDGANETNALAADTDHFYISIRSRFRSSSEDLCLDTLGTDVVLSACSGSDSQLWYVQNAKIIHKLTGMCLDGCLDHCEYELPQRNVHIHRCRNDVVDGNLQRWYTDGNQIKNVHWNNCLDVCYADKCTPKNDATTYTCHEGLNQKWDVLNGGYQS